MESGRCPKRLRTSRSSFSGSEEGIGIPGLESVSKAGRKGEWDRARRSSVAVSSSFEQRDFKFFGGGKRNSDGDVAFYRR